MKKLIFFLIIIISVIYFNFSSLKSIIVSNYPNIKFVKYFFKHESLLNNINNDYNVKFLPETQFVKLNFIKKKLIFNKDYYDRSDEKKPISYSSWGTFFLELYKSKIIIGDYLGNLYFIDNYQNFEKLPNSINLNLISKNIKVDRLYDIFVDDEDLYISYGVEINNCRKLYVSEAKINLKNLEFKNIFETESCDQSVSLGKIKKYNHFEKQGILLTTSSGIYNQPDNNPQKIDSIYGKILFIDLENYQNYIFSMGHRIIQGLFVDNEHIIATEHGPRGGDEINKILFKKNFGWPIASYGEKYDFDYEKKPFYKKSHSEFNFEEPIFYFTPSIGISEIKKIDSNFSTFLTNKFIISSLNGRSLFFVTLDSKYSSVKSIEKIFINQRIRDLEYDKNSKKILLALEEDGEIGVITSQ